MKRSHMKFNRNRNQAKLVNFSISYSTPAEITKYYSEAMCFAMKIARARARISELSDTVTQMYKYLIGRVWVRFPIYYTTSEVRSFRTRKPCECYQQNKRQKERQGHGGHVSRHDHDTTWHKRRGERGSGFILKEQMHRLVPQLIVILCFQLMCFLKIVQ